jgi:hypothetical protein
MTGAILFRPLSSSTLLWVGDLLSRAMINRALWAVGLVLQCALVFAVFRRGIAGRFHGFTVLILFYPLRAALLFVLAGRIDSAAYNSLFDTLALIEIPLLVFVALELLMRLVRDAGGWTLRRAVLLLILFAAACGLTWAAHSIVAEKQLADRVQVLMNFVMLALFAGVWRGSRSRNLTWISAGFAVFAMVQLAALAGRAYAMSKQNAGAYAGWSYVPACGYLAVVIFWLVSLARESPES